MLSCFPDFLLSLCSLGSCSPAIPGNLECKSSSIQSEWCELPNGVMSFSPVRVRVIAFPLLGLLSLCRVKVINEH